MIKNFFFLTEPTPVGPIGETGELTNQIHELER